MTVFLVVAVAALLLGQGAPGLAQQQTGTEEIARWAASRFPIVEGRVEAVVQGQVELSLGSEHGLFQGARLNAFRRGAPFHHPLTGEVLGYREIPLGKVVVTRVEKQRSWGHRLQPAGELRPGDGVRITAAPIPMVLIPTSPRVSRSVRMNLARSLEATGRFHLLEHARSTVLLARNRLTELESLDPQKLQALHRLFPDHVLLLLSRDPEQVQRYRLRLLYPDAVEAFATLEATVAESVPAVAGESVVSPFFARERKDPMAVHGLRMKTRYLSWADLEQDGRPELAVSTGERIVLYRYRPAGLERLWEEPKVRGYQHVGLGVMDVDGDGREDLVVGNFRWQWPRSYLVVWREEGFRTLGPFPLLLRVLAVPGEGRVLLGSEDLEPRNAFRRYRWQDGRLQEGGTLSLPVAVSLYNFALLGIPGQESQVLVLDAEGTLRLHGPSGQVLWEAKEAYPGYGFFVEEAFVAGPMTVTDLDGDGWAAEVVLGKNVPTLGFLEELKGYREGELHALRWTGAGMERLWQVVSIEGFLTGFALFPRAPGESAKVLVATVPTLFSAGASLDPVQFRQLVAGWGSLRAYLLPER